MVYRLILVITFQTNTGGVKLALNCAMEIMKQLSPCAEKLSRKVQKFATLMLPRFLHCT